MKLLSVNVSLPQDVIINDEAVATGIFKEPVFGPVRVRALNLEGDGQADLTVHGGRDKAVYIYPSEHYSFWRQELGQLPPGWGAFGENLTIEGLAEDHICLGDHIAIGSAVFEVSQPRLPCFKLAAKFQREDIIRRFLESRRTGFYVRVLREGILQSGDAVSVIARDSHQITIRELTDLYATKRPAADRIRRLLMVPALSAAWREHFSRIFSS